MEEGNVVLITIRPGGKIGAEGKPWTLGPITFNGVIENNTAQDLIISLKACASGRNEKV